MTLPVTCSFLTFNCFGGFHWNTPVRLRTLASMLATMEPDVVCLQEVQSYLALRLLLRTCTSHPHRTYARMAHAPAGALLTLARQPLTEPQFIRYSSQGAWISPTLMDRITQKGALISSFTLGTYPVSVINTHLIANYWGNWTQNNPAALQQQLQLHELAKLVQSQPSNRLLLVMGDFNIPRGCWLYEEFLQLSGLQDPLAGDQRPTYRPLPGVPMRYALPIDFVFLRVPPELDVTATIDRCFVERVPLVSGGQGYLSDHLGLHVTLRWNTPLDSSAT
ncbi:MAG: endonuclease/exonuclease/phosphatase family protein [Caldilineaceae bacterium]